MGQQRLSTPEGDNQNKGDNHGRDTNNRRPQQPRQKSNNTVLNNTSTRKGEVFRAQRRTSENVNLRASQHVINVPVNKSIYNGYGGRQFSPADHKRQPRDNSPKLKIMPIGGLGEMGIGKNMMAIEYDNEIIVIDCGFLFPGADYPGINYITPDISYLEENKHKIKAQVFTHGHLDHI
ncbi:MAG: ribonuclease J, partial [Candidatus Saccharimonadales bacterium]